MTKKILLIEGDGIGPEVVLQAKKIIDFFNKNGSHKFECEKALLGGCAYDAVKTPFPQETLKLAKEADLINKIPRKPKYKNSKNLFTWSWFLIFIKLKKEITKNIPKKFA